MKIYKYFEHNYINSNKYGELSLNYNSLIKENIEENFKFFTNNITGSFNRTS
jgi:hypothetical protein